MFDNKEKSRPVNNDPKKQEYINLMHLIQLLASMKTFACLINVDETSFFSRFMRNEYIWIRKERIKLYTLFLVIMFYVNDPFNYIQRIHNFLISKWFNQLCHFQRVHLKPQKICYEEGEAATRLNISDFGQRSNP